MADTSGGRLGLIVSPCSEAKLSRVSAVSVAGRSEPRRDKALFKAPLADPSPKQPAGKKKLRVALFLFKANGSVRTKPTPAYTIFGAHKCTKIGIKIEAEILGGFP